LLNSGAFLSLLSAALFGVSPVLAKLVIGEMSPILLAGLLYLGSGLGLQLFLFSKKQHSIPELKALSKKNRFKLLGAIISGGILAPLCLAYGIKLGSAFEVSLLLNLETVATTIIAWLIFHEHIGKHVWLGKILLIVGGLIISINPQSNFGFSQAGLFLLGACFFWGIDNNLTRDVEELSPSVLACVKGWLAGGFNTLLAVVLGQFSVGFSQAIGTLSIGAVSYGLSLVLFVNALRLIGASRTSTYFAIGPFFGMVFSVLLLRERPESYQWIAAVVMGAGLWSLYRENHGHTHTHEPVTHGHKHIHDDHHQHLHEGTEGPEPHDHIHTHEPLTHVHVHLPDIHHRHRH
jgi:drug/metabolite transporter (DMT)-like permease